VLNGYAIAYAALLIVFGRLAESRSREYGFLLGVVVFTAASGACGAATSVPMLVAFRVLQAAGAALLTPTSLSLVLATSAPERKPGAVRAWTAVGGLAAALGPVIGGLLVAASWRWVFLVNVPIGVAALLFGWRRLPKVPGHPVRRPNLGGAVLVTLGVGALTLGLVKGNDWGWGAPATLASLGVSALSLLAFVVDCARSANPLIEPRLFRVRAFSGASLVMVSFSITFGAMLLSVVLWDQNVWGWSALRTGLAIAPGPLMVPLFSFLIAGRLIARYGPGPVIAAGCAAFAAGLGWWALAAGAAPDYLEVLGGMLLTGVGVGLTLPTLMATALSTLPPASLATGSGAVNMLRQVGLAVGVALLVAVIGAPGSRRSEVTAFHHAWIVLGLISLAGAVGGALLLRSPRRGRPPVAAEQIVAGRLKPG
jgi:EmrB/QacA subfamily drug resistance transporter